MQCGWASEEVGCEEEEELMEVDGEVHSTKKLDQRQREIIKHLPHACDFADLSLEFFAAQKRHGGRNCRTRSEDRMICYKSMGGCKRCRGQVNRGD